MKQKRTRAETRKLIFQACGNILRAEGARHLTLEAVAREAGISKGGLLYHFPSKADLLEALFRYHTDKFDQHLNELYQAEADQPGAWLRAYTQASIDQILDEDNAGLIASLFAAAEEFPGVLEVMRRSYVAWQESVENCGLDPVRATLIRLVVDGLWFTEIYQYAPPDVARRTQIVDLLQALTQSENPLPI
ncbi:MAG: TetR/AcrR family transcriptional regulator [Chloroflexota bacterium]